RYDIGLACLKTNLNSYCPNRNFIHCDQKTLTIANKLPMAGKIVH
ncbi:MAG: hypothetical protein ACI9J5_001502, partial [Paraglaciecola sp.]